MLRRQIAEDFVSLGERQKRSKEGRRNSGERPRAAVVFRRRRRHALSE
jgi:hypothetical protein